MKETKTGTAIECIAYLSQQKDGIFDVSPHVEKKSLSQNSFYWEIVEIISKAMHTSKIYTHNLLLRRCEIFLLVNGRTVLTPLPDTDQAEKMTFFNEELHVKPAPNSKPFKTPNGTYRWYAVLKGSRDFNKEEMCRLIDVALEDLRNSDLKLPSEERFEEALEQHEKLKQQIKKTKEAH